MMGFLIRNLQVWKLHRLAMRVFKSCEIRSPVEFRSSKQGANGFSTE